VVTASLWAWWLWLCDVDVLRSSSGAVHNKPTHDTPRLQQQGCHDNAMLRQMPSLDPMHQIVVQVALFNLSLRKYKRRKL